MDWPVATVLLGTLGTLAMGIFKLISRRDGERRAEPANGRVYARATDLAEFRAGWYRSSRPTTCCVPKSAQTSRNCKQPSARFSTVRFLITRDHGQQPTDKPCKSATESKNSAACQPPTCGRTRGTGEHIRHKQQDALRGLLAEVGYADALLARELD